MHSSSFILLQACLCRYIAGWPSPDAQLGMPVSITLPSCNTGPPEERCRTLSINCLHQVISVFLHLLCAWWSHHLAWLQRIQSQMPSQCGRAWQVWYTELHAEVLQRPSPAQRLAVVQVTYNGLGDRLASIVSVFWFAAITGPLLLSSLNHN